jgi:hypothetical protein
MDLIKEAKTILDNLTGHFDKFPELSTPWTEVINETFIGLAKQYAVAGGLRFGKPNGRCKTLQVCTAGKKLKGCDYPKIGYLEFLYDHVWYVCDESGYVVELPFVMETEWDTKNRDALHKDFLKLITSAATIKAMVFWTGDEMKGDEIVSEFKNQIKLFQQKSESTSYLLSMAIRASLSTNH